MNPTAPIPASLRLPERREAYYGGRWHAAASGRTAGTVNPGTGQNLGTVADCGAEDVERAVAAAREGFRAWRDVPPLKRARILRHVASILRENAGELALIDAADCGNPVAEMVGDATVAAVQTEFFAGLVTEMKGASIPMGPVLALLRWTDEARMVGEVNFVDYGLSCSIWSNDLDTAHRTAAAVETGYVWVNDVSRHFLGAPFGGVKQSGLGREECLEELLAFTQEKNIHVRLRKVGPE